MDDGSRVAAITGAGSGIGLATAWRLARAGYRLELGVWPDLGGVDDLVADGVGSVHAELLDVRDRAAAAAFIAGIEDRRGRLDVLVTSAGVHRCGPSATFDWDEWDETLSVNLAGTYACVRAALPGMVARGSGRIITMSSELGLTGMAENAAYCASKGGVIALTKALAREYAPNGVLINSIAPGPVVTPMLVGAPEYQSSDSLDGMPIGRYGEPDEIAAVVESLAGDGGSFFVGQVLSPNGGAVI
jgi:NAD(P)-dependent dehydrogenase (short-subunit alcohol dehydrogenase family)